MEQRVSPVSHSKGFPFWAYRATNATLADPCSGTLAQPWSRTLEQVEQTNPGAQISVEFWPAGPPRMNLPFRASTNTIALRRKAQRP
jgi:hypothetical protein